jgi:hypothetical protein
MSECEILFGTKKKFCLFSRILLCEYRRELFSAYAHVIILRLMRNVQSNFLPFLPKNFPNAMRLPLFIIIFFLLSYKYFFFFFGVAILANRTPIPCVNISVSRELQCR